jgi:hypothetical protein
MERPRASDRVSYTKRLAHRGSGHVLAHELTGPVSRLRSNFINGLKHIPLKFTVKY